MKGSWLLFSVSKVIRPSSASAALDKPGREGGWKCQKGCSAAGLPPAEHWQRMRKLRTCEKDHKGAWKEAAQVI